LAGKLDFVGRKIVLSSFPSSQLSANYEIPRKTVKASLYQGFEQETSRWACVCAVRVPVCVKKEVEKTKERRVFAGKLRQLCGSSSRVSSARACVCVCVCATPPKPTHTKPASRRLFCAHIRVPPLFGFSLASDSTPCFCPPPASITPAPATVRSPLL